MKTRVLATVAILALMAFVAIRPWRPPTEPIRVGNAVTRALAPNFSLTDLSGQKLEPSPYRGKLVLLNFWATWCAPCRSEIPRFVDSQNRYDKEGFQIVGISLDDEPRLVHTFYQPLRMNYPVGIGNAKLAEQYGGFSAFPSVF